ncbi:MAG TPA: tocopherol cyclase family protein [Solirubrobacteraceae bacterium]|nr:tocopherol cyclase family protein [Solirubrobacteraceae bacterium]
MLTSYRRTGADLPFMDPRGYHGVAMEGYFWRITHVPSGVVLVVLAGVNRDAEGRTWGTVGLAGHPGGFSRSAAVAEAAGERRGIGVWAGEDGHTSLRAGARALAVDLGADACLDVRFDEPVGWPWGPFGGIGAAQSIPGLSQYWHPHLLGGRVSGRARLGEREIDLDGATVYAEKNWGRGGFPPAWWWGQAQGFARDDVCVAFAGGRAGLGRAQVLSTALVVRVGDEVVRAVRPLHPMRVEVGGGAWRLRARTARHTIELEGRSNGTPPHALPIPLAAQRRNLAGAAAQYLASEVQIVVRRGRRTLFSGASALGGLERGSS